MAMGNSDELLAYLDEAREAGTSVGDVIPELMQIFDLSERQAARVVKEFVEGRDAVEITIAFSKGGMTLAVWEVEIEDKKRPTNAESVVSAVVRMLQRYLDSWREAGDGGRKTRLEEIA